MFKKRLALVLVILMALSVVAGCTTPQTTTAGTTAGTTATTTAGETTQTSAGETTQTTVASETTTEAVKEQLTVSIGFGLPDLDADEMGTFLQEKFKMDIEVIATDGDKLKLLATSGDLPDIFEGSCGDAFFNQLKMEGLIRSIPEDMIGKYPSLMTMVEVSDVAKAYKQLAGDYYHIPRLNNADRLTSAMEYPCYYRADWAEKLGVVAPTTVDEYYDMLKAFAQNDPDGNGEQDTFGTSGWLWQVHFIPWADMYNWIKEDGVWIPGYISKNMVEGIKFWNKLYQEKILDPEFAVANARDMFYTGKIGSVFAGGGDYWTWRILKVDFPGAQAGLDGMTAVKWMNPLKLDAASEPRWVKNVENAGTLFNADCDDAKMDRILEFYDWTLSPEGRDFAAYGFIDKDYIVKDGKQVSLLPMKDNEYGKQKSLWEVYPSINLFNLVRWDADKETPEYNPIYPADIKAMTKAFQEETFGPYVTDVNIFVNNISTPAKDTFIVGLADIETEIGKLISSGNVEADYEAYKTKLLDINGLQDVIDEVNAAVIEQGLDG